MVTTFPFLSLYCVIPSETAQAPDIKPKSFIFYFWDISRCHFSDTSVPPLCHIGVTCGSRDRHNLYLYLLNSELIDLRVRMRKSKCSKWGSERGEKVGSSRKVDWIKIVALTCFLIIQFVKGQWLFSLRVNQSFGLWRSSVRLPNKFTNKGNQLMFALPDGTQNGIILLVYLKTLVTARDPDTAGASWCVFSPPGPRKFLNFEPHRPRTNQKISDQLGCQYRWKFFIQKAQNQFLHKLIIIY